MQPYLNRLSRSQNTTVNLQGLNLTGTLADGEWEYTQNMDAALAPIIARREKRVLVARLEKPNGMIATDKLAFVDGTKFYYNGYYYGDVEDSPKQMVAMGSRICIFPDKRIFDTETYTFSAMEQKNATEGEVTVELARADGTAYEDYTASATAPEEPTAGQLWLDTSGDTAVMKMWAETTGMWVEEATTYVCVKAAGIGAGLKADDVVTVEGILGVGLDGDWIISSAENDQIVYTGIISAPHSQTEPVTVARSCPDMEYVVELNNRLWGCSSANHEIYACALGDPTNWRRYAGLSTDSYAVTIGTPGNFTGAAVMNSSVVFTKESCLHKIYGTQPSNYQTTVEHYRGAEAGSGASLVRVNELLYYKSVFDVCVYDGTQVTSISGRLGKEKYAGAVAGANDRRLYISMQDKDGAWHLMVYDTTTGLWMREDDVHVLAFAQCQTETFMLTAEGKVWALKAGEYSKDFFMLGSDYKVEATEEKDEEIGWCLRTGELLAFTPNNKHVSKIQLLLELGNGAEATVSIRKDNDPWQTAMSITGAVKKRHTLPIYPKRCDRLQVEIAGVGDVKLLGMSRMVESGSEYGR